jgi:uncharacterized membrane protein
MRNVAHENIARRSGKIVAAAVAVAIALLLLPLVRDLVDVLGVAEDSTDRTVSHIVEWTLTAVLAAVLYAGIVAVPRMTRRRRGGVSRR